MKQFTAKYGETSKQRKANGKKLKEYRTKLGLSARQAAELLNLKNPPAIVNSEIACSSEMYARRMDQYRSLEHTLSKSNESKAPASVMTKDLGGSSRVEPVGETSETINNQGSNTHAALLTIAVRRLAHLEKKSEAEVWLHIFDELTQVKAH